MIAVVALVAAPVPAAAVRREALLTVADLPPGYESADDWNDLVRPGEPDPDVCGDPVGVGSVVNRPAITAYTSFFRLKGGPLLYEILVSAGPAKARRLVADVATAPQRCPTVRIGDPGDELALTISRMSVPDIGARASGVLIETVTEPAIRTRLIVFAAGGVTAILMAVGAEDIGLRDMHTIALAAARKLARRN